MIAKGFSKEVYQMLVTKFKTPSADKGTLRTYQNVWSSFANFCKRNGRKQEEVDPRDVANFIAERFGKGDSGSKINATITALDRTRMLLVGAQSPLADDPVIKEIRQSAKKNRPPPKSIKPKVYFDPADIYQAIAKLGPDKKLRNDVLRKKVETLMVLDSAARGADLVHIAYDFMKWKKKQVTVFAFWTKEAREASWTPFTFHCCCSALPNACTFCAAKTYSSRPKIAARRTKAKPIELKTNEGTKKGHPFFISTRGPADGLYIETMRKDLSSMMKKAKIEAPWSPHDLRGAVASKLMNLKAGEERVLHLATFE